MSFENDEVKAYKNSISFETRYYKARKILEQSPGKYPAILLRAKRCNYNLNNYKYILDGSMTIGSFVYTIRRHLWLRKNQGLYLYIGETLPVLSKV